MITPRTRFRPRTEWNDGTSRHMLRCPVVCARRLTGRRSLASDWSFLALGGVALLCFGLFLPHVAWATTRS